MGTAMSQKKHYNSRNAEKFVVRFDEPGDREKLKLAAEARQLSMNAMILQAIRPYFAE